MIRPCACTKSSSSPLEKSKHRESSKSCKSCGGKKPVYERGAQRGSMLSTLGLELSRVLDPQLTWKTASNGRQRAVRRARTSFTEINRKKSPTKSSKASKELTDKDSKLTGDMPVSESEKLGVSILGRRFSDTRGSVPIKKRRVLLAHSTSPPHQSSYSNHSGHVFEREPVSYQDTVLNEKQHSPDTNSGSGSEFSHERNFDFEKPEKNNVNPKICDAADFSGISILAAAACDSNIGGDFLNGEATTSKLHSSELQGVQKESNNLEKEELLHTSEDLAGRTDLPFETSSSSALPSKESNEKSDGSCNLGNSVNSIQTIPNQTTESSSRDVRFHWDLNTVMDTWDSHEEGLNSGQGVIDNVCEDGDHNEEVGNMESSFVQQVGFGETKNGSTDSSLVDTRAHSGGAEKKVICTLEVKIEEKPGFSSGNSATDVKESNLCFSLENGYAPVEWKSKDAKVAVADVHGETKSSINKDWCCSSPTKGAMVAVIPFRDSSLSTASRSEEEKAEAHCINFQSKVGSENSSYEISRDNAIVYHPDRDCEPHLGVDKVPVGAETCVQMVDVTHVRSHTTEKHASYFVSGTAKSEQVPGCVISGANTNMNASDEADHCDAGKSKENDVFKNETSTLEMKVDNAPNDIDAAKKDSSIDIGLEESLCNPGPCKNNTDGCIIGCGQVASEDSLECGYYSDASQNDANQASGMEKVELSGDDDSQYEDGELRESLENCWLDDGGEEGETERVDYGTDKDTDGCEAGSDLPAFVNCHVNNLGMPDVIDAQCGELGRDKRDARSDTGNGLQGHLRITAGSDQSNFGAGNGNVIGNVIGDDKFLKQAEGYRGSIHSANYRMKISGWDKLPGGGIFSGNGTVNSRIGSSRNHNDAFSDPSRSGGCMKRDIESSLRRDISSRTERGHSTDVSRRSDKPYFSTNRNPRAERDGDEYGNTRRSFGRSGLPPHLQGRDRGDWWGDNRHDSSSYSHHGSKNAAAAAVAKVESNGFVVASDGTIIKSGVAGSPGHLTRRPAKPSSRNARHSPMRRGSPIERERSFGMHLGPIRSREMSPDRPLFMGQSKAVRYGVNHVERYRGPVPDDIVDSLSPMHCPISRRDRSFSPLRRPLHMSQSHSRSPSRSRTRSPQRWASPRGRINYGISRGPVLHRRSRSPSFKSGFREHAINYASLSRNPTSPPHSSRWTDGRKKYQYRRCPGRSPPPRFLSRGHRFDSMDSPGRTKPDDYYRPAIRGRLPEFDEFDSGRARNDGMLDYRRDHDDRYVNNGNMKRLRYDNENGFRAQNLRPKSSEFERRERRGALDGDGNRQQIGHSPPRSIEGKGLFRSDGDGSNDMGVQRRPL